MQRKRTFKKKKLRQLRLLELSQYVCMDGINNKARTERDSAKETDRQKDIVCVCMSESNQPNAELNRPRDTPTQRFIFLSCAFQHRTRLPQFFSALYVCTFFAFFVFIFHFFVCCCFVLFCFVLLHNKKCNHNHHH